MNKIETFKLPSAMLNANIEQNLRAVIEAERIGKTFVQLGLVTRVQSFSILSAEISRADSSNVFTVSVVYDTFRPIVGFDYPAIVVDVLPEGLIVDMDERNVYAFVMTTTGDGKINRIGDAVRVVVKNVVFVRNNGVTIFNVLASLLT